MTKDILNREDKRFARLPQFDLVATYKALRKTNSRDKAYQELQRYTFDLYTVASLTTYTMPRNALKLSTVETRLSEYYLAEYMARHPFAHFEDYRKKALDVGTMPIFREL